MIRWGLTDKQRLERDNAQFLAMARGVRRFAWYPTRLADGSYVWLTYVYFYYDVGCYEGIKELFLWHNSHSSFPVRQAYLDQNIEHMVPRVRKAIEYFTGRGYNEY